jgi:putative aldouronate transport system permease protein
MIRANDVEIENLERTYWSRKWKAIAGDWRLYVMLVPLFFFLICWKYSPIGTMIMSFKNYNSSLQAYGSNWVGIYWFQQLMFGNMSTEFWRAFRNTFTLSFYGMIFGFPFPIILALLFSEIKCTGYRAVAQVLCYLPKFVSTVVITSLTVLLLQQKVVDTAGNTLQHPGPIAQIFISITGNENLTIMRDPRCFRAVYQVTGIWEAAGYGSIVYFAAILGISPTNYEAARIDGATKGQQVRYVTLPGITSTLVIMLILEIGKLLTIGYEKVILLEGTTQDLYETAETISTYVWHLQQGTNVNMGAGAAADMFNSVISMLLVIGSNQIAKKVSKTSLY